MAKLALVMASACALSACHLIDPMHEEKARILEDLDEPDVSYFIDISECTARPSLVRGVLLTPDTERKLTGLSFVLEKPSVPGAQGEVHWMPSPKFELDGDLLTNRFHEKLMQCDFGELVPAKEGQPDMCFRTYCPCDGDEGFDVYACQMTRHEPNHPLLKSPPETIEKIGLDMRSEYQEALELRDAQIVR
ncbi:MAG: hypothetical protein AAFR64_01555 [Pseudomonadota bacterium]